MSTTTTSTRRRTLWLLAAGILASLVMAGIVAYYASPHPDGLEYVAGQQGFLDNASDSPTATSPLADYGVAGIQDDRLSVGLAGLAGVAITAAIGFGLFLLLRRGRDRTDAEQVDG